MEPEERLIIHEIEIENFKSYAGKKILGPFHEVCCYLIKSFTSIVGPNGSGKSNVIDAILFVFGYRSSKIRSKKLSNLIHTSEKYPNVDCCSVYIHFRKIKSRELDPEFKLTFSRKARKDNSSDYYLNGNRSSYREVAQRLRDFDVDLDHNRFLILQGEVEQISLMKPKATTDHDEGFLEFLEDIIGSRRYKPDIDSLEKVIEEFDGQLMEKINRVKIAQNEKDGLEPLKNTAIEYIEKENMLNSLLNLDTHIKLYELKQKDSDVLELQTKISNEKAEIEKKLSENVSKKAETLAELKKLEKTYDPLFKEIEKQRKVVVDMERRELKEKQELNFAQENLKKLKENLKSEEETNKPVKGKKDIDKLKKGKEIMEAEILEIEAHIESLLPEIQKKTLHLQNEKEQKNKTLLERAKILSEAEVNLNNAKNALTALVSRREQLTNEIQKHKQELETKKKLVSQKQEELKNAQSNISQQKSELSLAKDEYSLLKAQENNIATELTEKRDMLQQIQNNESTVNNRSKIMIELTKQRDSGTIKGIFGRLGDLASIESKYDCAISSACGFLDHCLVDTMDSAVKCVEFLRQSGLGVASFIALDKMEPYVASCKANFKCPDKAERLFDLIRLNKPEFAPAFYFALRDTLVVSDIDSATTVAYEGGKRYRVVTLSGEIVEKSGAITCGGQPIQGRIKLSSGVKLSKTTSTVNPKKLQIEIETLESKLNKIRQNITSLDTKINALETNIKSFSEIIDKNPREITINTKECQNLETLIKNLKDEYESCIPDQDELHKAQMNLEQQKKEREKMQGNYDVVEEQIKKLDNQILMIRSSIIDTHQSDLNGKRRLLNDINSEISKAVGTSEAHEKLLKKSELALDELQKNIDASQSKLIHFEKTYLTLQSELGVLKESLQKLESENSGSCLKLAELRSQLQNFEKESENGRQRLLDLKLNFEEILSRIKNHENKVAHIVSEMKKHVHRSFNENGEEIISEIPNPTDEDISSTNRNLIHDKIRKIQNFLENNKPDFGSVSEYFAKKKLYEERLGILGEFKALREEKTEQLRDFRTKRLNEFMEGFTAINSKLKEMYQLITMGGDAELELVDSLNPFLEGVVFSVRPPNKSWKHIANLSGGEKTLSSLSLIFALHHYKPAPFYVMDEIDAALDFKNVSIVANYIKDRTQNAQFIIISLRDNMFELANRLVGIYKTDDCTKSVSLYIDQLQFAI